MPSHNHAYLQLYGISKLRARKLGLPFDLDKDEFARLVSEPCHWCGDPPTVKAYLNKYNGKHYNRELANTPTHGVDRFRNEKGYIRNNVVSCCGPCNTMKNNMEPEEFLAYAHKVHKHQRPTHPYSIPDYECVISGTVFRALIYRYKKSARRRDIPFGLTDAQFRELATLDCHWCGSPPVILEYLNFRSDRGKCRKYKEIHAVNGVDRFDNSGDYTISNSVPSCKLCNRAKHIMSPDRFISHIAKVCIKHPRTEEK